MERPPIHVDYTQALQTAVGPAHGVTKSELMAENPAFGDVHQALERAGSAQPHAWVRQRPELWQEWHAVGASWSNEAAPRVLGDWGAVDASTICADSSWVPWHANTDTPAIALCGPTWVDAEVQARPPSRVLWVGDGPISAAGDRLLFPGAADARFAALGPMAAFWAGLQGRSVEQSSAVLFHVAERCALRGVFDNPSYCWAATLAASLKARGMDQLIVVLGDPILLPFGRWFQRAFLAALGRTKGPFGGRIPHVVLAGDETMAELLANQERPAVAWLIEGPSTSGTVPTAACEATVEVLVRARRPVVRWRLPQLDGAHRTALAYASYQAVAALALRLGVDALAAPAATELRDRVRSRLR